MAAALLLADGNRDGKRRSAVNFNVFHVSCLENHFPGHGGTKRRGTQVIEKKGRKLKGEKERGSGISSEKGESPMRKITQKNEIEKEYP